MHNYDPAWVTRYLWYRGVGILDPRAQWVPPLGPVGTPDPMGISTMGDLYTYIHTYIPLSSSKKFWHLQDFKSSDPFRFFIRTFRVWHFQVSRASDIFWFQKVLTPSGSDTFRFDISNLWHLPVIGDSDTFRFWHSQVLKYSWSFRFWQLPVSDNSDTLRFWHFQDWTKNWLKLGWFGHLKPSQLSYGILHTLAFDYPTDEKAFINWKHTYTYLFHFCFHSMWHAARRTGGFAIIF